MYKEYSENVTIEQNHFLSITVTLGDFAFISQGDGVTVVEPQAALALSNELVKFAANHGFQQVEERG